MGVVYDGHQDFYKLNLFTCYKDCDEIAHYVRYKGFKYLGNNTDYGVLHHDFQHRFYSRNNTLVIDCKGTGEPSTFLTDNFDISVGKMPECGVAVFELAQKLHESGQLNKHFKIVVVGHSKGGYEAMCWGIALKILGYENYEIITANAPSNHSGLTASRKYSQFESYNEVSRCAIFGKRFVEAAGVAGSVLSKLIHMTKDEFIQAQSVVGIKTTHYRENEFPLNYYGTYLGAEIDLGDSAAKAFSDGVVATAMKYLQRNSGILNYTEDGDVQMQLALAYAYVAGVHAFAAQGIVGGIASTIDTHGVDALLRHTNIQAELVKMNLGVTDDATRRTLLPGQVFVAVDPSSKKVIGFQKPIAVFLPPYVSPAGMRHALLSTTDKGEQRLEINYSPEAVTLIARTNDYAIKVEAHWLAIAAIAVEGLKRIRQYLSRDPKDKALQDLLKEFDAHARNKGEIMSHQDLKIQCTKAKKKIPKTHANRLWIDAIEYAISGNRASRDVLFGLGPNKPDPDQILQTLVDILARDYNEFCHKMYAALLSCDVTTANGLCNHTYRHLPQHLRDNFLNYLNTLNKPDEASSLDVHYFFNLLEAHGDRETAIKFLVARVTARPGLMTAGDARAIARYYDDIQRPDLSLPYHVALERLEPNSITNKYRYAIAAGVLGDIALAKRKAQECLDLGNPNKTSTYVRNRQTDVILRNAQAFLDTYEKVELVFQLEARPGVSPAEKVERATSIALHAGVFLGAGMGAILCGPLGSVAAVTAAVAYRQSVAAYRAPHKPR